MPGSEARLRILVVEDEVIVARDIQLQLEALGYEHIAHAATGEQAVELAGELRPDLVLMDVQLAGTMDGVTAADTIRAQYHIPVVFLTAFATDDTISRAVASQPFGYLIKPFAERELRTTLEIALYRHSIYTELRESEERARTLIEWSPEAIVVHREGEILYLNPAALSMFGLTSAEEVVGTSIFERVHPQSWSFVRERMRDLSLRGVVTPMDLLKGLKQDGSIIEVETRSAMITYNGAPAIHSSMHDITARVLAEKALRTSEAHNRAITQSAQDAIITSDSTGIVVGWNSGAEKIFGYAETEILGQPVTLLIPERYVDRHRAGLQRVAGGGRGHFVGQKVELEGLRKDGSEFPLDLSLSTWRSSEGWFATAIIRDITDRRLAEATLRLESAALEAAANAIVITNFDGTIEWANSAFTGFTGYTVAEALGRTPGELLKSGKHDPAFYRNLWDTIISGSAWHGEIINRRKDGSHYTEEMTITPLKDIQGRITHFIAVKQDITERKQLEEQFHQAQKMESVGRLAGGVAHDFNNMLGVILGNLELALPRVNRDQQLHAELLEVRDAAERSAILTRQLLAFARKQAVERRALDINVFVDGALSMLRRLIREHITLTFQPGEDIWLIEVDGSQLNQILSNLCVNARDAIADVGAITVATTNCTVDAEFAAHISAKLGDYVRLTVRDNGCGMDEGILARVFEPFFTTKAVGVGTGLGLSTVYGAVRQNDGFVTVASEPGLGATFEVYLPRFVGTIPIEVPPVAGAAAGTCWETILLAEDEPSILKLASKVLTTAGYTVLAAATPEEALRLAAEHSGEIHLLLTDVVMPGMNGQELARALLSLRPKLLRLFMSGYPADTMAESGFLPEGVSFIQKPFVVADLRAKVRETLDQH